MATSFVVNLEGYQTIYDATVADLGGGILKVNGTIYPDDHPALDSGNTAYSNHPKGDDATSYLPIGVPFEVTGHLNIVNQGTVEVVQLYPFAGQKLEDQLDDTNDGPFDPGG